MNLQEMKEVLEPLRESIKRTVELANMDKGITEARIEQLIMRAYEMGRKRGK